MNALVDNPVVLPEFKPDFTMGWICNLFHKALVCPWTRAALAMCLRIKVAF